MAAKHLIRWGAPGFVAAFASVDAVRYPRGAQVVLRTVRGLELGEVLASVDDEAGAPVGGEILRGLTAQDELLQMRLLKNREAAFEACSRKIGELGLEAALLDVEHLFDGHSLIFYFLGDEPPGWETLTQELAEEYDAQVQFRAFSDAVATGCGPDCGTDDAAGCGSCGTGCAVAQFCSTHKH